MRNAELCFGQFRMPS